jgi:hypothetical protein
MNKFNVGETVLYKNGDSFELGIVKEVIPYEQRAHTKQDGLFGKPSGELYEAYKYRVWYHTGDTTALTDEHHLHKIDNAYAFTIIRKSANPMDINLSAARKLACKIASPFYFYDEAYYEVEDWITSCIEGYHSNTPNIDYAYLKCAIAIEVKNYLDISGIDYDDHTIRECTDACFDSYENSVLNSEFIQDTIARYIANRSKD